MNVTTTAADRFTDAALECWSLDQFEATAREGLAPVDACELGRLCLEAGEDYDLAEEEVLGFCRWKAAR
jgi:hypothetical protein